MRFTQFFLTVSVCLLFVCQTASKRIRINYSEYPDSVMLKGFDELSQFQHCCLNGHDYLILYNKKNRCLQLVGLDTSHLPKSILLPEIIVPNNQLNVLKSFYYYKPDSIFLLNSFSLSIIDSEGTLKFKKIINAPEMNEWPAVVYGNFLDVFPIYFDARRNQLILRQHCGPCGNAQIFFDTNVLAIYDFKKDAFIDAEVPFPDKYKKSYLGDAILVLREINNDSIILNFQADPDVTIFNREKMLLSYVTARSGFQKSDLKPLDTGYRQDINRRSEHLIRNPLYLKILYDKYLKVYYRLFLEEIPLKNEDGSYNDFFDKSLVLMVLDENFNVLSEKRLGNGYLWNYSFVTSKGLYIMKNNFETLLIKKIHASKISFDRIVISIN
ncbi:MAG: DUF4221 family protein [Williamsia sp.]|nr:DUF4221 family protein [Williamsia sp.]